MWEAYQSMCDELGKPPEPKTEEERAAEEKRIEEKVKEICKEVNVPPPDLVAERVCEIYKAGVLVTIDKSGVVPPLHIPVKSKWLGVESERQFKRGTRKVDFKIELFEEKDAKQIDRYRKSLPGLLDRYSFRLADEHRWVPHAALPLIEKEMTRIDEQARTYVKDLIGAGATQFAQSRRQEMQATLNEMCHEFHPGRDVEPGVMDDIMTEAVRRLNEAMRDRFLPRIGKAAVNFIPPADPGASQHADSWAQARTLLASMAQYFRDAVTNSFFFQGYDLPEEDLLPAMDVARDWIAADPWSPQTRRRAKAELDGLKEILASKKAASRETCEQILNMIEGRWRPEQAGKAAKA